jgi:hypothetical protein
MRQWAGNEKFPNPWQTGTNLYYAGDAPASVYTGVFNISAIGEVFIENLAIQSNVKTSPYKQMSGINIDDATLGTTGAHGCAFRDVEITYFQIGVNTFGVKGSVDGIFENVKIENCTIGVTVANTGNQFERCFLYQCTYGFEFVATAYGTHGTKIMKTYINNAHYPIWIAGGNESEILIEDCWIENILDEFIVISPTSLSVREFIIERCHFYSNKTTGYIMDFSKITAGIVHIYNNIFNNIASHTIAINPSAHIIMEGNVKVTAVGSILNYVGTSNSGTATISASTSVTFNHKLIKTPTHVECGFEMTGYGTWRWSATNTQITITVTTSGTYIFSWYAICEPQEFG